jgi:tRNA threonylcarbamoyladenosine biosynthesis protein TsaB
MNDPLILHIETATNICSVALSLGDKILSTRESDEDRSHGSLLTVFMQEVMDEADIKPDQINAVAVSKGPGSYTGLRIGVSVTKGFAYARKIPVIGIVTLQAMVIAAKRNKEIMKLQKQHPELLFCPMIDARRMEVFSGLYKSNCREISPVSAIVVEESSFNASLASHHIVFFGNGSGKIRDVIQHPNAHFIRGINPSSTHMVPLALKNFANKRFEDTAYFEPYYLKDFVATTPKKKVL